MRKGFIGYYRPTQKELEKLWKESIFIFDTSVLLNIYRYSPETREDFFKLLEELKQRTWIPHQVALEFHEQRENVISQQNAIYEEVGGIIRFLQKQILDKYRKGHPFAEIDQIKSIFEEAVEKAKTTLKEAQSKHPDLIEEDIHLTRLTNILENKVGEEFPKEKANHIYEDGQKRYKDKVPPGYEDKTKEGTKPYGDLLIWYQLIEYAKSRKKSVIFITDDTKEDWWRQDRERNIIGPRPELIQEVYDKANVQFYIYLADEFIKRAQQFLNVQIQPSTIEEAREIRQSQDDNKERLRAYHDFWVEMDKSRASSFNELLEQNILKYYLQNLEQTKDPNLDKDIVRWLLSKRLKPSKNQIVDSIILLLEESSIETSKDENQTTLDDKTDGNTESNN